MSMLEFLQGRINDRKLRLFACACCRSHAVRRLLSSERSLAIIDAAERFVEGTLAWEVVANCGRDAPPIRVHGRSSNPRRLPPPAQAEGAVRALAFENAWDAAWGVVREGVNLLGSTPCDLLREIVGNPHTPLSANLLWLAWNEGTVRRLADGIHDDHAFDRLPILADALEDAGCTNEDILTHCRQPGEHVRGCWVVDLLLGKM
jgi:hypothetical protein